MRGLVGTVIGDIVGSSYEFHVTKNYDFEWITPISGVTDDTIMTLANAKWLLDGDLSKDKLIDIMHYLGNKYFFGYAGMFKKWLETRSREPYNSWGNGSAMRVSPIGWYANSVEECLDLAKRSAEVTHNHPEGIKGAQSVALCIYYQRMGMDKNFIKNEIETRFGYDLSKKYEDIKKRYGFKVACKDSVPQAIISWLESENFEDCIRKAVALGGDADTLGAIAGSICVASLNPKDQPDLELCRKTFSGANRMTSEMLDIINEFYYKFVIRLNHEVTFKCKECGKEVKFNLNKDDYDNFFNGTKKIDEAFPYLNDIGKLLITFGLCEDCLANEIEES